ncbi:TfoX/Sxy family protein [Pseudomonas sp. LJDD11]|uniref:TfoX/Sxy family protein n=1 Tax=Pseudomonas sp. LJDD11 TaxID=2931984 RepID=UPI00211C4B42|nr:TfoX/Sxy family protein [Pseudomonas sp. LJDD11]MCQ9422987.1 TfoX/Sxy family protein [Pseudomonas sp. LJDD11]
MNELAAYIEDIFALFGPVSLRRMFGGHGIFRDGVMFGLVFDGTLYLKADAENIAAFEQQGLEQFTYARQGKLVGLSYYRAPDHLMEDPHDAVRWAQGSFAAALRADRKRAQRTKRHPAF